jgi:hypothetical protein
MWKQESPEVRAKYHQMSLEIKARHLALHPEYRYTPRKSSEIRRRAPRRVPDLADRQHTTPGRGQIAQPFEHNAHRSPQVNNEKAGLRPTSDITRRIPGAQRFLPPVVAPGWTPYHLLPGAAAPAEPTLAEEASTEELQADNGLYMNDDQDFNIDEFIDNQDFEAEFAQMLGGI